MCIYIEREKYIFRRPTPLTAPCTQLLINFANEKLQQYFNVYIDI